MKTKKLILSTIFGAILVAAIPVGIELVASFLTPAWPAYLLRPVPISRDAVARWHSSMPDIAFATNSWLMRDRERSVTKPEGSAFRSVFIGDSFLEGGFTRAALPSRIEGILVGKGQEDIEAVNLGVAGTSPVEYYYRLRDVGLKLTPDAVVLMFYSGNDIVQKSFAEEQATRPLIAELPRPSLLASVAPHAAWLGVSAFGLAGISRGKYVPGESNLIAEALRLPQAERVARLAAHMKEHYFPELAGEAINEILSRADERFWSEYQPRRFDREYLQGWVLQGLISWEASARKLPKTPAEAAAEIAGSEIDATLTWIAAAEKLARSRGVKFLVALIPVGTVDPDFVAYWQPWPRYYAFTLLADARHKAMAVAMARTTIPFVDLTDDLQGMRGTYRKTDMHWTEAGHEVVAARLAAELTRLRH